MGCTNSNTSKDSVIALKKKEPSVHSVVAGNAMMSLESDSDQGNIHKNEASPVG